MMLGVKKPTINKLSAVLFSVLTAITLSACQEKPDLAKIEEKLEQKKPAENSVANQVLPTDALKAIDQTLSGANQVGSAKEVKFSTVPYVYELPKAMQEACSFENPPVDENGEKQDFCTQINIELVKVEPVWIEQVVNKSITNDDSPKLLKFKQTVDGFVEEHLALINEVKESAKENGEEFSYAPSYHWAEKPELLPSFNNVAQIVIHSETYTGGAHGIHGSSYLIFDMDLQSQIALNDVLQKDKSGDFYDLAYAAFKDYLKTEVELKTTKEIKEYESTWEFELSENFYFSKKGIVLSYAPYHIGSFAQGTIELTVPYDKLADVIKAQYLPQETGVTS